MAKIRKKDMSTSYRLTGKKNARKFVRTVDISEDGFKGIRTMLDTFPTVYDPQLEMPLENVFEVFGGNCYRGFAAMAVEQVLDHLVLLLEETHCLKYSHEEAMRPIRDTIFPFMCYGTDESGNEDGLRFFNGDYDEIIKCIAPFLQKDAAAYFSERMKEVEKMNVSRPAGESAAGLLLYIATDSGEENENEEYLAN